MMTMVPALAAIAGVRHAEDPRELCDGEEFSYLQFVGLQGDGMFAGVDLPALGSDFKVPVLIAQGAEDLVK